MRSQEAGEGRENRTTATKRYSKKKLAYLFAVPAPLQDEFLSRAVLSIPLLGWKRRFSDEIATGSVKSAITDSRTSILKDSESDASHEAPPLSSKPKPRCSGQFRHRSSPAPGTIRSCSLTRGFTALARARENGTNEQQKPRPNDDEEVRADDGGNPGASRNKRRCRRQARTTDGVRSRPTDSPSSGLATWKGGGAAT